MDFALLDLAAQKLRTQSASPHFSSTEDVIDISGVDVDEIKKSKDFKLPAISSSTASSSTSGYLGIGGQKPPRIDDQLTLKTDSTASKAMANVYRQSANTIIDRFCPQSEPSKRSLESATTTGPKWFDMPAVQMTKELDRELKVIRMRHLLDPKRFYKRESNLLGAKSALAKRGQPAYFQIGTIVDSPLDGLTNRVPKKMRKKSIVDQLLVDEESKQYLKKRFNQVQQQRVENRRRGFNAVKARKSKK